MANLNIPVPQLEYEPAGPVAALEKPVNLQLAALSHADGEVATQAELQKIGAFVYRVAVAGGSEEIWNGATEAWEPTVTDMPTLSTMEPLPLLFKEDQAQPWQGVLVAAGEKDHAGQPRYTKAVNGAPLYRLRAYAQFKHADATTEGLSPPSSDLSFVSATEQQRFAISFDTETAADCTLARMELKNAALQPVASIELRANGPELEISNQNAGGSTLARVVLTAAGDIELHPAAGRRVIVAGDMEIDHLRYLPAGAAVKQDLV